MIISTHAVERFVERAMGLRVNELTEDHVNQVKVKMEQLFSKHFPSVEDILSGDFLIKDQGITFIKRDSVIITIKDSDNIQGAFNGGIMKGGTKIKKHYPKTLKVRTNG